MITEIGFRRSLPPITGYRSLITGQAQMNGCGSSLT
jgi:hypothetical protein